jgi:hypothetical protein
MIDKLLKFFGLVKRVYLYAANKEAKFQSDRAEYWHSLTKTLAGEMKEDFDNLTKKTAELTEILDETCKELAVATAAFDSAQAALTEERNAHRETAVKLALDDRAQLVIENVNLKSELGRITAKLQAANDKPYVNFEDMTRALEKSRNDCARLEKLWSETTQEIQGKIREIQLLRRLVCSLRVFQADTTQTRGRTGFMVGAFIPDDVLERVRKSPAKRARLKEQVIDALVNNALSGIFHAAANTDEVTALVFDPVTKHPDGSITAGEGTLSTAGWLVSKKDGKNLEMVRPAKRVEGLVLELKESFKQIKQ